MACLRGPNSWGRYGAVSGPRLVGAAPPPDPRDGFDPWFAVTAHRVADGSATRDGSGWSESLRDSEERMSLAAEAANMGMWAWDVVSGELWMTDKGRALFGIEPEARLDNATLISRVHPEDRAVRRVEMKRAVENRGEYAMEYRVLLPDGTLRWIDARGHCMNGGDNGYSRLVGVSMDVTAQKQAQEALRESEARFRAHGRHRACDDLDVGHGQAVHLFQQRLARLYRPVVGAGAWQWVGRGRSPRRFRPLS